MNREDMTEDQVERLNDQVVQIADAFTLNEDQIENANEDMQFCNVDGGMWVDYLPNLGTERTKLELDITSDYVNRYVGEWTKNPANVTFTPDDEATDDDDAELLSGIYRADYQDNDGALSEKNAIAEVSECGIGHFKMMTRFEDEEDPENERQNVHWEPLHTSYLHVVWDPQAKRIDKADAKWCSVLTPYTERAFKDTYPDVSPYSVYQPYVRGNLSWIDRSENVIYVAEHYAIKIINQTLMVYQNVNLDKVKAYDKKDIKDIADELAAEGWEFVRERKTKKQVCEKSIFTSVEYIEDAKRIPGKYIPIIPMYGFRKYINNREFSRGLVRKLKDANRLFNTNVSRMADNSATSGDRVPIFTDKQVEGKEEQLADGTLPFHVINPMEDAQGNEIAQGPVGYYEPNVLDQSTIASTQVVADFVQRMTGQAPQDNITSEASGVLVDKLRQREDMGTQVITDNILESKKHSGKVYLSIANEIYADLRTKRVRGEDGNEKIVKLNTDIIDDETGNIVKSQSIGDKKFKVDVDVGPQYESQREATVETLERLLEKMRDVPQLQKYGEPIVAMLLKNISGTGIGALKDMVRTEMIKLGFEEPETDEEKQMLEQMAQQKDPADELNEAISMQQKAEGVMLVKKAENLMADSEKKEAETMKTKAQTVEILEGVGKDPDGVTRLKYNPQTGGLEGANSGSATG